MWSVLMDDAEDAELLRKLVAMESPDTVWVLGELGLIRGTRGIGFGYATVREAIAAGIQGPIVFRRVTGTEVLYERD